MVSVDIQCDICSQWEHGGMANMQRGELRKATISANERVVSGGWKVVSKAGDGKHLCPNCADKTQEGLSGTQIMDDLKQSLLDDQEA